MNDNMTNGEIVARGAVGSGAALGAAVLSNLAALNPLLQTLSLAVGLAVGVVTLVRLCRKNK